MTRPTLELNGKTVEIGDVDPNMTTLNWLRQRGLTGTKEGCAEGECGACAVAVVEVVDGQRVYKSVNSCLLPIYAAAGRQIISVEGVGAPDALHPVQKAMVKCGGSQCGYCTPGFIVSMFAEYYRPQRQNFDLEAIGGNLCRCTGYRPIVDAAQSLPIVEAAGDDAHYMRLRSDSDPLAPLSVEIADRQLVRPTSLADALTHLRDFPEMKIIAGGTDAVVEINQLHRRHTQIMLIDGIDELRGCSKEADHWSIGACEPLADLEERLRGQTTALDQLFPLFSSRLIRNRATFGGNICNASPIGDGPPVLLALDALVVAFSMDSTGAVEAREIPLEAFFSGYRETNLKPGELLGRILIPLPLPHESRFYKVSKRVLDDISTVAAAFSLRVEQGIVREARLAYGGVAATPVRAHAAEQALVGRAWNEQAWTDARAALDSAFTPMDDHRGSARYRSEMVTRLFDKFFAQTRMAEERPS